MLDNFVRNHLLAGFGKRSAEENVTTDQDDTDLAPHGSDAGVPQQLPRPQPGAVHQHRAVTRQLRHL